MSKSDTLRQAYRQQRAGNLDDAWRICRALAARDPHPDLAQLFLNLGHALRENRRLLDAITVYREALALRAGYIEAWYYLGDTLLFAGQAADAVVAFRAARKLRPDYAPALAGLAAALDRLGRLEEALEACLVAVQAVPDLAPLHANLGAALHRVGRNEEAVEACRTAIRLDAAHPGAWSNLGNALMDLGRIPEALEPYRTATRLAPDRPEFHVNLGGALQALDQPAAAMACYREALRLDPGHAAAHCHLGVLLQNLGRLDEALEVYRAGLTRHPGFVELRFNHATALLAAGRMDEGWREYEWRWRQPHRSPPDFPQKPWQGEALCGRTILLQAEQGYGDTLQFVRYAPMVAARGGRVLLEVPRGLVTLLRGMPNVEAVVTTGEVLPPFDVHCPLMSLPRLFGTMVATIPGEVPYLTPPPYSLAYWRRRIPWEGLTRVGLVWAGDPRPHDPRASRIDRRRSIALSQLAPLAAVPDVRFYSLQKGPAAQQVAAGPFAMVDQMDEIADFADTAGLIAQLDLVITVDTAVAHLAGAMGVPVWLLSRFDGCWRWLHRRADSPWYPTMRIFRQPRPGDWPAVVGEVAEALAERARCRRSQSSALVLANGTNSCSD